MQQNDRMAMLADLLGDPNQENLQVARGMVQADPMQAQQSRTAVPPPVIPQNYVQRGNNAPIDLGPSQGIQLAQNSLPLDYSQAPVEFGGQKGYRVKGDPFTVVMQDGTKLSLGNDTAAARARMAEDLKLAQAKAQIAHTQAQTDQIGKANIPAGYRATDKGLEPIPGGPFDQKAQALAAQKTAGATDVDLAIGTLRDAYDRLEKGGGITSTKNEGLGNVLPSIASSGVGQAAGKLFGTTNQSARNDIAMTRPALLGALMKATGMSAKQMDSNAELKLWLATATDPTLDVESNRRALANIEKKYLGGGVVKPAATELSGEDAQALQWATANPTDPRAAAIKARLGAK